MAKHAVTSHFLVALQFSAIVLCVFPFDWPGRGDPYWLLIWGVGALLGAYVLIHNRPGNFAIYPEIRDGARLITSGPYRWLRHPMYTSLLLSVIGVALFMGHWLNLLGLPLLFVAIMGKMDREEIHLGAQFPEYVEYAIATKRLIPYLY